MLRVGLALFTFVVIGASVGLAFLILDLNAEAAIATTLGAMAAICLVIADALIGRFRVYRHGVEEALSVSGVVLLGVAAAVLGFRVFGSQHASACIAAGLVVSACASAAVFHRFGFQYAGVGAIALAAITPAPFDGLASSWRHLLAAAIAGVAFASAHWVSRRVLQERFKDDAEVLRAAALVCVYLSLNVYAIGAPWTYAGSAVEPWFRTTSYIGIWLLPIFGLQAGIRLRDRRLIDASLAIAIVTVLTNKSYLGLPRQPWDPLLLGVLLLGAAIGVRRWLTRGPGGERGGYTAVQLLESEGRVIQLAGLASATVHPGPIGESSPTHTEFSGGRSGGAGGGGEF